MVFYIASVVSFYVAEILLFIRLNSVAGAAALCMAILFLISGVAARCLSDRKTRRKEEGGCICTEPAATIIL